MQNGKVCVMQKEFQASFCLILFFRVLLMWLDGNLHVKCSLRFLIPKNGSLKSSQKSF